MVYRSSWVHTIRNTLNYMCHLSHFYHMENTKNNLSVNVMQHLFVDVGVTQAKMTIHMQKLHYVYIYM